MGLVSTGRSSGSGAQGLVQQFQDAQRRADEARKAQQEQLTQAIADLAAQVGGTFDQAQANLIGLGESARTREERRGTRTLAAGQQDLTNRGLGNTTLGANLRRDVDEDVGLRLANIDEGVRAQFAQLLGQRAGSQLQIGNLLTNAIQSQNIQGPDLGLFAQLLAQSQGSTAPVTARIGASTAGLPNLADSIRGGGGSTQSGGGGSRSSGGGGQNQSFGGQTAPGGGGGGVRTFHAGGEGVPDPSRNIPKAPKYEPSGSSAPKPGQKGSFVQHNKPTFQQYLMSNYSGA